MSPRDRYDSLFQYYAGDRMGWRALKAQAIAESNLDPRAVSPAGAVGLMQFMLPTWIEWHGRLYQGEAIEVRTNPERSIELGAAYMVWLAAGLGRDWRLARAAYNWGIGNVKKHAEVAAGGRLVLPDAKLPPETRAYLARIDRLHQELTEEVTT